jgi:hypothetical protein
MNLTNMLTYLAQISDAENPTIFPFPFEMHLALAVISFLFFSYRFATQKKLFQLIFAVAAPLSLLLWLSDSKTLFYIVGIIEFILILVACISSFKSKPKKTEETTAKSGSKEG